MNWTKITNDSNGNPRYVCHFYNLLTEQEKERDMSGKYTLACKRANTIGGRKFNNKQYGGGIVFSSYNIKGIEEHIKRIVKDAEQ